jgi:hypothetical protein
MPAYIYRWPDGETSIVCASDRQDAFRILDELGTVETKRIKRIKHDEVMITLLPGPDGEFTHGEWGSRMRATIMAEYPLLDALYGRTGGDPTEEELAEAVEAERNRLTGEEDE